MLGWGKTGAVDASATVSPPPSQEIYRRYAVALYRHALLDLDDSATAGHVVGDPIVNECALAAMPERGEDDRGYHLAELIFRRSRQLAVRLAQPDRRSGQGALGLVLSAGLMRAVLRKLTTSPPAVAEDGDQE